MRQHALHPFDEIPKEAEKEKIILHERAQAAKRRQKAQTKASIMMERTAVHQAKQAAAREESLARDQTILAQQREQRHRRVYEDRVRAKQQFEGEWDLKFRNVVQADMDATTKWLKSGEKEAAFRVEKELEIVKRKFYAAPTPETAQLERALRDPANTIFAHMAHHLYHQNVTLHEFFQQYDLEVREENVEYFIKFGTPLLSRPPQTALIKTIHLDKRKVHQLRTASA